MDTEDREDKLELQHMVCTPCVCVCVCVWGGVGMQRPEILPRNTQYFTPSTYAQKHPVL